MLNKMDRRFRGPTPEKPIKTSNIRIPEKDLKKIIVKIKHNKPNTDNQIDETDHGLDKPEEIKIYRCQGEGSRPIFAREDIKVNNEDGAKTISTENIRRRRRTSSSDSNSRESSRRSRDNSRQEREREQEQERSRERENLRRNRHSPNYNRTSSDIPSTSRREYESHSRNRSRSRESRRSRRSRSRSRSSRREFGRRRNSRSPNERHHRYDRQDYGHSDRRDRRYRRSRSPPRYERHPSHLAPLDPAAIGAIPLIIPPEISFYGHEDALWYHAPIRGPPPVMVPRGFLPPRGMYRAHMYGMRPPIPPRLPPYLCPQRPPQYNQLRGSLNRPTRGSAYGNVK